MLWNKIKKGSVIFMISMNMMILDYNIKTQSFVFNTTYAAEAKKDYGVVETKVNNGTFREYKEARYYPFTYDHAQSEEENKKRLTEHYEKYGYPEGKYKDIFTPDSPKVLTVDDPAAWAKHVGELKKIEPDVNQNYITAEAVVESHLAQYKENQIPESVKSLMDKNILDGTLLGADGKVASKEEINKLKEGMDVESKLGKSTANSTKTDDKKNTTEDQTKQATSEVSDSIQVVEGKDIESKSWSATLTMVAIGVLTSRLMSCKMTVDMALAAGAGVAFMAGEALAFFKLNKALKGFRQEIDMLADKETFDAQKRALLKIREGYEAALSAAQTKRMLQLAAAVAFGAAAAAAALAGAQNASGLMSCNGSLVGANAKCSAMFASSCAGGGTCYQPFKAGAMTSLKCQAQSTAHNLKLKIPLFSAKKEAEATTTEAGIASCIAAGSAQCPAVVGAQGACNTWFGLRKVNSGVCANPAALATIAYKDIDLKKDNFTVQDLIKSNPSYWSQVINFMFPKANASLSLIGVTASVAVKYVLATSKALATKVDTFLHEPYNRMKIWLALMGLTYMAKGATEQVIEQLKSYIQQIDTVLTGYEDQSKGIDVAAGSQLNTKAAGFETTDPGSQTTIPGGEDSGASLPDNKNKGVAANPTHQDIKLDGKMPCVTAMRNGKCSSIDSMVESSGNFSGLDSSTKKQFKDIAKTLDGVNGTDTITAASLGKLDSLSSKAAGNYNDMQDDIAKKYKIPKDELKGIGENQNELLSAINKELKNHNMTAEKMYESFSDVNPTKFSNSLDSQNGNGNKSNGSSNGSDNGSGMLLKPDLASFGKGVNGYGFGADALKNMFGDDSTNAISHSDYSSPIQVGDNVGTTSGGVNADEIAQVAGQFGDGEFIDLSEVGGNLDINEDDSTTLFQVITNRYQKSGYTRLFPNKKLHEIDGKR